MPAASIAFDEVTVVGGKRAAVFQISVEGDGALLPKLRFATVEGTLKSGRDFTPTEGTVSFRAGDRVRTIIVPVGDKPGTFGVAISEAENATIIRINGGRAIIYGTITDKRINDSGIVFALPTR